MIARSSLITCLLIFICLFATQSFALANYDTYHQIIYSKQMLKSDLQQQQKIRNTLEADLLRLKIEQERQDNEQLTYERLIQQREDVQDKVDESKTTKQREHNTLNRDKLQTSLDHTRIWLAAHEQDVMKKDSRVRIDMERLNTLEESINRLTQVLRNNGIKPDLDIVDTSSSSIRCVWQISHQLKTHTISPLTCDGVIVDTTNISLKNANYTCLKESEKQENCHGNKAGYAKTKKEIEIANH